MAKERAGEPKDAATLGKVLASSKAVPEVPSGVPPKSPVQARDIGIDVPKPTKACDDRHCPFHGTLPVRGQTFEGVVVSTHMQRTAIVEREHLRYIQKFERYEKRTKRFYVHSPPCLGLKDGDRVLLMECRPISKTVSFVAIQNKGATA